MMYDRELQFVEKLLEKFRLEIHYINPQTPNDPIDIRRFGLEDVLNYNFDSIKVYEQLEKNCQSNTIYQLKNILLCNYLVFKLPGSSKTYAYIGPYAHVPVSKQEVLDLAKRFQVTPGNLSQLEKFFANLPIIGDDHGLFNVLYTLGEYLWGDADNFTLQYDFDLISMSPTIINPAPAIHSLDEAKLSIQILEDLYETEQLFMQAIANGQPHKAELYYSNLYSRIVEARTTNPLRNLKNYTIILNTLLRKAAEIAAVHPIHLDAISSQYARKIEALTSETACQSLQWEMVRKYCLLVKNHSLKGYSFLVRKVITKIDYDLTADLSLRVQAQLLNVNASYLSTLFKKETGQTLTEYVNRKRIEHAILLLNSTDMQIQMVAQYSGISDVNYFTKTFKKIVGTTPKVYREMLKK